MINRNDIEAGDKVFTRDGGCLVARLDKAQRVCLGGFTLEAFDESGLFLSSEDKHPLDIIRIEKAPKPVVEEVMVGWGNDKGMYWCDNIKHIGAYTYALKLVFVNNVWDKEKSEQVK